MIYILRAQMFRDFCQMQNELKIVKQWHHQHTNVHIHIDVSQDLLWEFHNLLMFCQIFIQIFTTGFQCSYFPLYLSKST